MREIWVQCFFFQAEDGIRDGHVTGVQTCALPISDVAGGIPSCMRQAPMEEGKLAQIKDKIHDPLARKLVEAALGLERVRSEERRVGKEWRAGRGRDR